MSNNYTLNIPRLEVPIGADFRFGMDQVRDQLGLVSDDTIDDATVTVEVYNGEFPSGSVYTTLTGTLVTGSQIDFYALWKDDDGGGTGTDSLSNGQDMWAKYIVDVGTDAKGIAFAILEAIGA